MEMESGSLVKIPVILQTSGEGLEVVGDAVLVQYRCNDMVGSLLISHEEKYREWCTNLAGFH